ncbi:hypothetical protein [Actinomyces gaoshouyii]|uniref:EamA family transporter n=1 Tax=Actinomyces gaoshouyii TaxID=1960083 RepID=A0A8H9LI17_9ACTO|nr:hypothetical protein [Actinomyces gaoshouyii]GGO95792.1 hypothetical protein GCM10011612_04500 [Actinomyces gaoshouyii]
MTVLFYASISVAGLDISDPAHRAGVLLALAAGLDALAAGMAAGALFYTPLAAPTASGAYSSAGTALAVLSTVIPCALDQINLGRLSADTLSLLASPMPATSMALGIVMLRQMPDIGELPGLVLVSLAVAGRS